MKTLFKYISIGAVFSFVLSSCDMDLVPKGSISYEPGDQIINKESDLEGFRANILYCFRALDSGSYEVVPDLMVNYFNAMADYGNNYGSVHRLDDSFTTSDSYMESQWANNYVAIKNYNIFIEGTQEVADESLNDKAKWYRGEAYLARAYSYLHLVRHFGNAYDSATASTDLGVPLVLVYDQSERPARATVQEVYDQIKTDLDSAYVLLSGAYEAGLTTSYNIDGEAAAQYPTLDAVRCMYARYYLDTGDYANAAAYAAEVVDSGRYPLASTATAFANMWRYDTGTEPIIQFYADESEGIGSHSAYMGMSSGTIDGETRTYYAPYFIPTAGLVDSYDASDLRLTYWFDGANGTAAMYPSYHSGTLYNDGASADYAVFVKYFAPIGYLNSSGNIPTSYHAVQPFRISEMYLIAAEAYAQQGNTTTAATYLNELQSARGAATTSGTLANVKTEWFKEVVGEGLYFSCLKRWGDGFDGRAAQSGASNLTDITPTSSYTEKVFSSDDYHWQWPIPSYEMQVNANLVQNDGYSTTEE